MNIAELQQQAAESLYKGKYGEAIAIYEQCIDANPSYLANYWQLGLATLLQGDEILAKSVWLSVLMQGSPEENDVWLAELIQLLNQAVVRQIQFDNFQLAERICLHTLELAPNIPEAYYYMAICLRRRNEIDEAISYLKKAIEINSQFAEAYSSLGALLIDRFGGEFDEAINNLQKAIKLKPNLVEAYYNMATLLQDIGEIDEAIKNLQKAIELKPNLAEAHYAMGMCLRSKGEIDEAIGKLQEAVVLKPEFTKAFRAIEDLAKCDQSGYAPPVRQGHNVWDAILFKDDNLYRLFYLIGDSSASPFWSVGKLGAAISSDMKKWEYIGVVLQPDPAHEWQSGRILAGSVYKENGVYYLFYSASPPGLLIFNEGIGLATSTDGISWRRCSDQFVKLDTQFYCSSLREGVKIHYGWRDPYIFKDPRTKKYCLFITANCKGEDSIFRGCVGLAVSSKIDGPYKVLPPVTYPLVSDTEEGIYYEMERPQVIYRDGKYHLFFSASPSFVNPKWIKQVGRERITNSSLYWYVSDNITGPFVPSSVKPIVKGSESTHLYGTTFIEAPTGKLTACGNNTITLTLEVSERFPVRWENGSIEILLE